MRERQAARQEVNTKLIKKINFKKVLTECNQGVKIRKSLEGDEINWSLKIEQIYKLRTSNSFISKFFERNRLNFLLRV